MQLADVLGKRSNNSCRVLAGDINEHREAGIALDERGDVRVVRPRKKVSFPMPRHGAILNLGEPLADGDHIEDMSMSILRVVAPGVTHPPRSTACATGKTRQHQRCAGSFAADAAKNPFSGLRRQPRRNLRLSPSGFRTFLVVRRGRGVAPSTAVTLARR